MCARPEAAIAILSSRESLPTLVATANAGLRALDASSVLDVVINGNPALAEDFAAYCSREVAMYSAASPIRVWSVACGDKAHAWNRYLADIWPDSEIAYFVDGYARLNPDACRLLGSAMREQPGALGGSGVPSVGRTAGRLRRQMLAEGGFHGNFCAIRGDVMASLRAASYRLPLGLYRTDSTLAACLRFGLDPSRHEWDPTRILVHPDASWVVDEKPWWRWGEVRAQFRRVLRQGQGALENRAVRHHLAVQRRLPQDLPATAAGLVSTWLDEAPEEARALLRRDRIAAHALGKLQRPRDWSSADLPVRKLLDTSAT